jgi:hypothetical protein
MRGPDWDQPQAFFDGATATVVLPGFAFSGAFFFGFLASLFDRI